MDFYLETINYWGYLLVMAHFEYSSVITAPPEKVFEFIATPRRLAETMPSDYSINFLTPQSTFKKGSEYEFKLVRYGVSVVWTLLIEDIEPPHSYRDRQTRGPFSLWVHTHKVEEHSQGTLLKDLIEYDVAFGILGKLAQDLYFKNELHRVFETRHRKIQESLG